MVQYVVDSTVRGKKIMIFIQTSIGFSQCYVFLMTSLLCPGEFAFVKSASIQLKPRTSN